MPLDSKSIREFKVVGTRPPRPDGVDKVTGRALYGADMSAPGMLIGRVLRSPHAHAEILSIDTSAAEALPGVKAVVTSKDFGRHDGDKVIDIGEDVSSLRDIRDNCLARGKVLYDGHAVAAVAAVDAQVAKAALKLIKVEYRPLPHVTDVDAAMRPDAPIVQAGRALESVPEDMSQNVTSHCEFGHGDLEAGFAAADLIVERSFSTAATHQGYIEPHACLVSMSGDGRAEIWCCTQGQYNVRDVCSELLGMKASQVRVTASEIGGGFGGKTTVFIEPVAMLLSRKASRPVKIVMSRADVFRATGPTITSSMDVRIGMSRDGRITAAEALLRYSGGAYPCGTVDMGAQAAFAAYDLKAVRTLGWNALTNRPKEAAYRAPGAPQAIYAVESVIDEMCQKLEPRPSGRPAEKRRAQRHEVLLWSDLSGHRPRRDARGRQSASALVRAARARSGPRPVGRVLVQFRRQLLRVAGGEHRRHGQHHRGEPRHRRLARLDQHDGGRGAWHPVREGPHHHRGHQLARPQRRDGRQPRDLHGGSRDDQSGPRRGEKDVRPRGPHLGHRRGRGALGGRRGQAVGAERGRVPPDDPRRDRRRLAQDRRSRSPATTRRRPTARA